MAHLEIEEELLLMGAQQFIERELRRLGKYRLKGVRKSPIAACRRLQTMGVLSEPFSRFIVKVLEMTPAKIALWNRAPQKEFLRMLSDSSLIIGSMPNVGS